ncbi:MAG: tetratricopeptide repeat protein [Thermoguttaceae bacterium]
MSFNYKKIFTVLIIAAAFSAATVRAADNGQEDLDKATELKLSATTVTDWGEVIRLTESALEKGLDKSNTEFANKLLASTLVQRATVVTATIQKINRSDQRWENFRLFALSDLEKSIKLEPKQPQALILIAQLNGLPGGDEKRAKEAVSQAVELTADDPQLRSKAFVLRAEMEKDPEKRLPDLNEAVRLAPNDANVIRARGIVLAGLEKYDEALSDLNKAIELDSENPGTYELKSLVLTAMKKYDEALAALDQAQKLAPNSSEPWLQKRQIHLLQKKLDEAIYDLNKAIALDPSNANLLLLRSSLYLEKGDKEKALADAKDAVQLLPKNVTAIRDYALILIDMGKFDEALEDLNKAAALDPSNADLLKLRSLVYLKKGDKEKALADAKDAVQLSPKDISAISNYAAILTEMDKFDEALAQLEKARKLEPNNPFPILQIGMIFVQQKQSGKAIDVYGEFLKDHPNESNILYARGNAYLNLGLQAEAVADYEKAYKDLSKDSGLLNNFAWVLATSPDEKLRDGQRAVKMATEACKLTEYKQGHILSTLAAAYAETGDFDNAVKWSEKSAEAGKTEDADHAENYKKELETYKAHQPYREILSEKEGEKPAEKEGAGQEKASTPEKTLKQPAENSSPPEEKPAKPRGTAREIVEPFNGKNLEGWDLRQPRERSKWTVGAAQVDPQNPQGLIVSLPEERSGELINREAHSVDIYSVVKFGDCNIDLEFMIPKDSNSGVYVMGEYEIQILDSFGKKDMTWNDLGAIYEAAAPKLNAAKAPGQWQNLSVEFIAPRFEDGEKTANARFVKVTLNGQVIQENVEMKGPTPGGLTGKEVAEGPLMFQGDHGPVAFRNIKITLPGGEKK